jgi:hypothetical protein
MSIWTRTPKVLIAAAVLWAGCLPKAPQEVGSDPGPGYPSDFACPDGTSPVGWPPPTGIEIWCQKLTYNGQIVREGPTIRWYANGKREYVGNYANGRQDGLWSTWHPTGDLSKEETYVNGVLEGPQTAYFSNGLKAEEGLLVNGRRSGDWTIWGESPRTRLVGNYTDGDRNGRWVLYDENGAAIQERTYRTGRLLNQRELAVGELPPLPPENPTVEAPPEAPPAEVTRPPEPVAPPPPPPAPEPPPAPAPPPAPEATKERPPEPPPAPEPPADDAGTAAPEAPPADDPGEQTRPDGDEVAE